MARPSVRRSRRRLRPPAAERADRPAARFGGLRGGDREAPRARARPRQERPQAAKPSYRRGSITVKTGVSGVHRALELDPNDPEANRIMGSIQMHMGRFDIARRYHEKAMALSPSDAYIKGRSAAFYNFAGEPERALELLDEAGELDPFLHVWCVVERVATLYALGRFREAIEAAVRLTIKTRRSRLYHSASDAALGEHILARDVVAEAIAISPDLTSDYVLAEEYYRDSTITKTLIERLTRA